MATTYKKEGVNGIKITESVVKTVPLEEVLAEIASIEATRDNAIAHTQEMVQIWNERLIPLYEIRTKAEELGVEVIPEPEPALSTDERISTIEE